MSSDEYYNYLTKRKNTSLKAIKVYKLINLILLLLLIYHIGSLIIDYPTILSKNEFSKQIETKYISKENLNLDIVKIDKLKNNNKNYYEYTLRHFEKNDDLIPQFYVLTTENEIGDYTKLNGDMITENIFVKDTYKNPTNNLFFNLFFAKDYNEENKYFRFNNINSKEYSKNIDNVYDDFIRAYNIILNSFILLNILIVIVYIVLACIVLTKQFKYEDYYNEYCEEIGYFS